MVIDLRSTYLDHYYYDYYYHYVLFSLYSRVPKATCHLPDGGASIL